MKAKKKLSKKHTSQSPKKGMDRLVELFKSNNYVHMLADGFLISPICEEKDAKIGESQVYRTAYVKHAIENGRDTWALYFAAKVREIKDDVPRYYEQNTKVLLDGALSLLQKDFPTIDKAGTTPIKWEVDLACDAVTVLPPIKDYTPKFGGVTGIAKFIATPDVTFNVLKSLKQIPSIEFEEVSDTP